MSTIDDYLDEDNPIVVIEGTYDQFCRIVKEHMHREVVKYRWIHCNNSEESYRHYIKSIHGNGLYKRLVNNLQQINLRIENQYRALFDEWMFESLSISLPITIHKLFYETWGAVGPRPKWLVTARSITHRENNPKLNSKT